MRRTSVPGNNLSSGESTPACELGYLASYTHRGRFYTLPEIARFDDHGLWSHEAVWFSRNGTLLSTVEAFVLASPNGYYAHELADVLHAEVQEPLRDLVQ